MIDKAQEILDFTAGGKTRVHIEDPMAAKKFGYDLFARLERYGALSGQPLVLLCIGTDRSTGDCLGPLVGTRLASSNQDLFAVYGTLDQPVHASNLQEKLDEIYRVHQNPLVIAVDASLGSVDSVGFVTIGDGALHPGAGVNKRLPPVGEIHITGIVNVGGFMEYLVLQNTRLNLVMRMAEVIAQGVLHAITLCSKRETREI
ncbi:sporulation protein YyaC [Desulfofundulus kuznetsovii DSM 6115]|uniref:Sporulation protein YyaC n=1 Tax=Desulfofundulus kuznetsovii (strain DSM 6115 / VKM B-1805 / 17) TaxID=760568 RepID=A0AAU8Q034_DESK7|nr:sporulation protein YyaC [Desulfofundulus kuznetsovii DSM 6115]